MITIFTPTYNRKSKLLKLYNSLINQTDKEFVWLIVDDGSTDGTRATVYEFAESKKIKVQYFFQSNHGKCAAHNCAVLNCSTKYLMCVDDDDTLDSDAVNIINRTIDKCENELGYVFPRNNRITKAINQININDIKYIYGLNIETSIVLNACICKGALFQIYDDEKFMSEEILYNELAKIGKFTFINIPICHSAYLDTGITKNLFILWRKNPHSSELLFKSRFEYFHYYHFFRRIWCRIKCITNYISVMHKNKLKSYDKISLLYFLVCYIPGVIIFIIKRSKIGI